MSNAKLPRLRGDLALRLRQGLRLDQQALPLVAAPAFAEAHDHGMSGAFRLDAAREQRISGNEELEIVEADAPQARRAGILHDEKIAGAAAPVARPSGVQRLDHHEFRCTARLLRQARLLPLRELARNPFEYVREECASERCRASRIANRTMLHGKDDAASSFSKQNTRPRPK